MKFIITIPASLSKGKKPTLIPAQHFTTEAFNLDQAMRRATNRGQLSDMLHTTVEPLDDWLKRIPTL